LPKQWRYSKSIKRIGVKLTSVERQSRIDIVQAAGRALRRHPGKDCGYILLPLVVPSKMEFDEFAETTAFRQVVHTITALSTQDSVSQMNFERSKKAAYQPERLWRLRGMSRSECG
jgi:predicted helicase